MIDLLPNKEELVPISNDRTTFYDCKFNKDFDKLEFIRKLQIVNDIIRQTIMPDNNPDPNTELTQLKGNCHTAAKISIEYLKMLGLGVKYRYVFAKKRYFDPDDVTTKHAIVLVYDHEGNEYQFDATPFVGYKYGTVVKTNDEKIYSEYVDIEGELHETFQNIRLIIHNYNSGLKIDLEEFELIINQALKFPILNGYLSYCYLLLNDLTGNRYSEVILNKAKNLNAYLLLTQEGNIRDAKIIHKHRLIIDAIKEWRNELDYLVNHDCDYRKQLELSQNIVQELKRIDKTYEKIVKIDGNSYPISHISPRFFMEKGLNVVIIKPSADRLGVHSTIREKILKKGRGSIDEYHSNLSRCTLETGVLPILFSHSVGKEYERAMNGNSHVILVKDTVEELYKIKKILRETLGKKIINKEVMWYDGERIVWHPFVTNLVHSTDNPSEAALHYLIAYPEHQLMTRFMYPNPKLEKVKVK